MRPDPDPQHWSAQYKDEVRRRPILGFYQILLSHSPENETNFFEKEILPKELIDEKKNKTKS